jgi:hypothetical protein
MKVYPPTVHLNGTAGKDLLREYKLLYRSVCTSIECLADATCHGRDYYVQEDGNFALAQDQRREMFRHLEEVRDYAIAMVTALMEQGVTHIEELSP